MLHIFTTQMCNKFSEQSVAAAACESEFVVKATKAYF